MSVRFYPKPDDFVRIRTMAEIGVPLANIARAYNMSDEALAGLRKKIPELEAAIREGQEAGNEFLCGQLWNGVREGNMTAIIFACKIRLRMSDKNNNYDESLPNAQKPDKISFKSMNAIEAARVYQQVMRGDK